MSHIQRKYGWKKSKTDERDYKLKTVDPSVYASLPLVDEDAIPSIVPEVLDQEQEGSCTAHALSMADRIVRIKQGLQDFRLSRQFLYANERIMEGTLDQDAGAEIRDGAKVLATIGIPPENIWPYEQSNMFTEPTQAAYQAAIQDITRVYLRVDQTLDEMKMCIHEGYPFAFGVTLFEEFESDEVARTGIVSMPTSTSKPIGGHAILCVGYNDTKKTFKGLNSWSDRWGDKGYCYFPYDYLTNPDLCNDLWTIRSIAPTDPTRQWVVPQIGTK